MDKLPATLDAAELRYRIAAQQAPRVLDVRTPGEFAVVHIPGSYNVPLDTLREHRAELNRHLEDPINEVVLVCRTGNRAAQAERALAEAGMTNVHVLAGGILAWEAAGAPLNRGRPRWDLERQVRLTAGALVVAGVIGGLVVPGLWWLAAVVGAGLMIAALTNTCALGAILARLPFNHGSACDIETIVDRLVRDERAT